jgi:protein-L-isoaspartate O-methyltransferase
VEIHEDVIRHAREAIAAWKENYVLGQQIRNIDIIHGNVLELDIQKGECALGFDRIYIGAAIEMTSLPMFKKLLKPGGILVGPGEYEEVVSMTKEILRLISCICCNSYVPCV